MPYLTFLNTDAGSMVTMPFDAWVFPIYIKIGSSLDTMTFGYTNTFVSSAGGYSTPDWVASDWNTLTTKDSANSVPGAGSD